MKLDMFHNADLIASIDLRPDDTFMISADIGPAIAGLADRTVLSWGRPAAPPIAPQPRSSTGNYPPRTRSE